MADEKDNLQEENQQESQESAFPGTSLKGENDLAAARASVNKVAVAEAQLRELMGAWFEEPDAAEVIETADAAPITGTPGPDAPASEAQVQQTDQVIYGMPGYTQPEQAVYGQAQPTQQPYAQPGQPYVQPAYGQPVQQPGQPVQPAQDGYWRGFQPVQAAPQPVYTQPVQAVQPLQPAQPAQVAPAVSAPQVQPLQPDQGAQFAPPVQPVPQAQAGPQPSVQPIYRAQAGPQPSAQPAGYSQAYTPQIQQPVGYVSAQDFTVAPQPQTPAYAKSNRSTLAIVVVVVVALLAIVAAIVIGRILANAGATSNSFIDNLTATEQEQVSPTPNGNGSENGSSGSDQWGFNWDKDNPQGDTGSNNADGSGGSGVQHIYGGGIDADDGELHDAWDKNVSYSYTKQNYTREGIELIDFYNKNIGVEFDVEYPELTGDIPNLEKINETIRASAMQFVEKTYNNPTSQAREMLEYYAESRSGVPKSVDAILESDVDYAISYNNEDFISICFSDEYAIGSWAGSFVALRTVNINLKTGEVYELDDVLTINDEIAADFIDNLAKYDNGNAENIVGRDSFIGALQGKGAEADNVSTCFFVDGNGKVNFGATYAFANDKAMARGWWDYTLTDKQLEDAKKDSSIWDCIK